MMPLRADSPIARSGSAAALPWDYSRLVRLLKIVLPAVAAFLLGVLVIWPGLVGEDRRFELAPSASQEEKAVEGIKMMGPRFFGTDARNQPFGIAADLAHQDDPRQPLVRLEMPRADIVLKTGVTLMLNAETGLYSQKEQSLDLSGVVDLFDDRGYELHTTAALIDFSQGIASGKDPVQGQGPFGTLSAKDGFILGKNGETIHFLGRSKVVFSSGKQMGDKKK